jgi:hypothetical protein
MFLQSTPLFERLITHIARKWTLPSVQAFMSLQIKRANELLITHITGEWTLASMYNTLVSLKNVLVAV